MKKAGLTVYIGFALLFFGYFRWFLPYEHVSTDLHKLSFQESVEFLNLAQMWTDSGALGLGQYDGFTNWNWPVKFITALMMQTGVSSNTVHQIFLFGVFLIIGYFSIYKLARQYSISESSCAALGLFYLLNSYILLVIDGGQLLIALSYSVLPLSLLFFLRAKKTARMPDIVKASFLISLLGFFDIRFLYLLALLLILDFFYNLYLEKNKKRSVIQWIKVSFTTFLLVFLLNFFWLFPFILAGPGNLPISLMSSAQLDFLNFTSLEHAMLAQQPHWPANNFGEVSPPTFVFLFIPLLAFVALIDKKHKKTIVFWFGVSLISIFLLKGTNPPFGFVYEILFSYVPGFSLFRDSTKFFFLLNLSYALLIGFSLDYLAGKRLVFLRSIFITYLVILFVLPANFILDGTFEYKTNQQDFQSLQDMLKSDKSFSRVLWIPQKHPLSYTSANKPGVEALRITDERPFNTGVIGRYDVLNFIRDSEYMGDVFDVYGIGYISYPDPNFEKLEDQSYYKTFLRQLEDLSWVGDKLESAIHTFKTNHNQERFFITKNTYLVSGSDRVYEKFLEEDVRLSDHSLIFLDERNHNIASHLDYKNFDILYDNFDDAILTLAQKQTIPAKEVITTNKKSVWRGYDELIVWRNFLEQKFGLTTQDFYPGGIIVLEGKKSVEVELNRSGVLLARVFKSPRSGSITFVQGDKKVEIPTGSDENVVTRTIAGYKDIQSQTFEYLDGNFFWVLVEEINPSETFFINVDGDINVLNQFAVTSVDFIKEAQNRLEKVSNNEIQEFDFEAEAQNLSKVSYNRLSPTKYKISVPEISKPSTLVFSEKFDKNWKLYTDTDIINPYPVYSNLNGYWVKVPGEYMLYYEPQKYVLPSFVVSMLSFILLNLYIIRYEVKVYKKPDPDRHV